ncbi:transglycosylase domain-containing protein [Corynebacterium gottingense]|uniref:Penicillin-binding protein n=1 Tax=Corynebacterium gottingense TaxID=2041036 RepID=A0ABX9UIG6_9CORY|nr:penicillin-binding protein [Corynebacterium gottingense]WJZ14147.1 Penicillin-binding protein 1A [Corynebacterium gottingense]WJZ16463.1 Penicillin-binding protein 1A [Corynebacterium gottingense]
MTNKENASESGSTVASSSKRASKGAKRSRWWQWLLALLLLLVLIAAIPAIWFAWNYSQAEIPEPNDIEAAQISNIYFSDAQTELARVVPPEGNREQIPLDAVPEEVQNAVLAAEDRDFWGNSGFSFTGFGRAAVGQLTGNTSAGGGSTITQQYVKNSIVGNEHSYERKAKELVYSIKMANSWSKEEVLNAYLNTVYFGRNAYGIEAAAHAYFSKPASELTVEEGAVLAALIQRPSQLDPWNNEAGAQDRWNYVMDGLVEMGAIDQATRAGAQFPETRDPATYSAYTEATGPNGLIKNQVMTELAAIGITEDDLTNRGLQITTTIDKKTQDDTVRISEERISALQDDARTGVVAVEPGTGAVRAYYGGNEASGWDYANAGLQTGSTFKIFALAAALQQGIPLTANFDASPVTLPGGFSVTNSDGGGGGIINMTEATRTSSNTAYMRIQDDLDNTTQDTADMAHALGVARSIPGIPVTLRENGGQPYEGIVLGQYQSRVLDMAAAVATLTDRGVYHPTHFVQRVTDAQGEVLYENDDKYAERRVSAQVADNVIQAMQTVIPYSYANLAGGRPSAGKTGTAQMGDTGQNKDAWMVGSTPQLSVAVWVGTADNTSPIFNEYGGLMYGAQTPAKIWKDVLDTALEGQEIQNFHEASPVYWGVNPYGGGANLGGNSWAYYNQQQGTTQSGNGAAAAPAEQQQSAAPSQPEQAPAPDPAAPAAPAPQQQAPAPAAPAPAPAPQQQQPAPAPDLGLDQAVDDFFNGLDNALQ